MSSAVLRRCAPCLAITVLAACSDSAGPPAASPDPSMARSAALPVVSATVHVLPGLDGAHPRSINEFEEVVGSTAANVPFYYSASRGIVLLDHTGFATAQAVSINDHGIMAGTAMSTPVVWLNLPGAQFRVFEKPASQTCNVAGLNFDGAVIGTCVGGGASFGTVFAWHGLPTETSGYRYNAISDDRW